MHFTKRGLDETVLVVWLAFTYLGVVNSLIVELTGGIGYVMVSWAFFAYFALFYRDGYKSLKESLRYFLPFALFAIVYMFEFQFVFRNAPVADNTASALLGFDVKIDAWHMFLLFPFAGCAVTLLIKSDAEMKCVAKYAVLAIFCAASVYGFVMGIIDPSFIRSTASAESGAYVTYGTIYAMVVVIPAELYIAARAKGWEKAVYAALAAMCILCVFVVEFYIAIFATLLGVLLFIFGIIKNVRLRTALAATIAVLIVVLFSTGVYVDILEWLADVIPLEYVKEKIDSIIALFQSGDAVGSSVRFEMYWNTFLAFLQHPFFGNIVWHPEGTDFFVNEAGRVPIFCGHSTNLDVLSCCGVLLFALYAYFFAKTSIFSMKKQKGLQKYAFVICLILFVFISTVNSVFSSLEIPVAMLFAVPCLLEKDVETGMLTGDAFL